MSKIGQMIDRLFELREKKRNLKEKEKEIQKEFEQVQSELLEIMQLEGLSLARGEKATASVKVRVLAHPVNFEEFVKWAAKEKRFDMLYKRVNSAPVAEMLEKENKLPPGVETYTEAILNLRKI